MENSSELGTSEIDPVTSPAPGARPPSPHRPFQDDEQMEDLLDAEGHEDEGEGDELYGNNFEADYRAIPQLDDYQSNIDGIGMLDDEELEQMSPDARAAA